MKKLVLVLLVATTMFSCTNPKNVNVIINGDTIKVNDDNYDTVLVNIHFKYDSLINVIDSLKNK